MRYKITAEINSQFLNIYSFLEYFAEEDAGEWYVAKSLLDQIDKSEQSSQSVSDTCQQLFAQTRSEFFDPRLDISHQNYLIQKAKNQDGFDAYEKIVGDINTKGTLGQSIDNDMIPTYKELTVIRMMMKDGMFETALRYWITDIMALGAFSEEDSAKYSDILETLCLKYGTSQQVIDALKTAPKGHV